MGQLEGIEMVAMEGENEKEEVESGSEEGVRWEDFMPKMVLRVLLVEADDPTRQIIAALLRKYNYKVAAISDGLKAWEILKRRHSSIDLILTELDLPSISGYALLTLIMEHNGCKDIPVIIMSSQDSISMVLKCFLKGAADYLIKPVRKNELKNLWRHVWKRLSNNTGYNPQKLTAAQLKTEAPVEDNPANNHPNDNASSKGKSTEDVTNAQSPSTSRCMEDLQGLSQMKHREEHGLSYGEGKHEVKNVKVEETEDKPDQLGSGAQPAKEVDVSTALRVEEDGLCSGIATGDSCVGPEYHMFRANIGSKPITEAADLIGRINIKKGAARQASSSGDLYGHNTNPELELCLKSSCDSETEEVHEKHILNHSKASAFSWYNSSKKPRTTFLSTDGEQPNIQGAANSLMLHNPFSSNKDSKSNNLVPQARHCDQVSPQHQFGLVPVPGFTFDSGVWASYGALFQATISSQTGPTTRSPNSALQREESPLLTSPSLHSDPGTRSCTQECGLAGDEVKARESVEQPEYCSSHVVDPSGSSTTQCNDFGSQNKLSAHGSGSDITEVNATASGLKGSSLTDESEGCKPFDHDQIRSTMGLHSAERLAALAKFREKRKGRSFEKKVRYQSRKKLAEQRPRVKGQFVRRVPSDQVLVDAKPQI